MFGRNGTKPKLDTGTDAKPTPDGKKKDDKDAEKRAKQENDFWQTLKGEVETAKLLPKAAEDHRKELELQKILGRDLNAGEKERIADLMQQARIGKLMTGLQNDHLRSARDIADQEALLILRRGGATEQQLAVEKAIFDKRSAAIDAGATLADLQTDAWKAAEAQLRSDQTRLGVLAQQNKALDDQAAKLRDMARDGSSFAKDALTTHGTATDRQGAARADYDKVLAQLNAARNSTDADTRISPAAFNAGVKKAGEDFRAKMREIGTEFSNRMNRVANLFGTMGSMIGGKLGEIVSGLGGLAKGVGDFQNTKTDISEQFSQAFGQNSPFVKGLGKAVGGAMAGLQIGESIAGLGKMLGANKGFQTGSKVGGAIGGLTGNPLIAAGASVVGGLIGSLFYKAPKGKAIITGGNSASISGNKGSVRDALAGTSGSIQSGLQNIATQLGGSLGSFMVSIGKYKDNYRVSSSGASNVDTKKAKKISGLVYDGKDEAAAITAAIKDAILDGAITGVSDLMQKVLRAGAGNIDKAVNDALKIKEFEQSYKALFDPIGAAADAIVTPLKSLRDTMTAVGASSADLAKLNEMQAKQLQDALKEQVSGFQSLLDDLNGDAGGVTAMSQLTANLAKLDVFKSDIAAGKTVNQDEFTALAQKVLGNAGDVYGTNTSQYQDIIASLKGTTSGAITNQTNAFNAASGGVTNQAIADQTNAITTTQAVGNDYLRQIAEAVTSGGYNQNYGYGSYGGGGVYNGRLAQMY